MASLSERYLVVPHPLRWAGELGALLARELAPSSRKVRSALRMTLIATIGAGLIASCHVYTELGLYIVWLLVGAGPMMSPGKALKFLFAEALALVASVVIARAFAETPWLMLPFLFAMFSYATYKGTIYKLGAMLLLIEVVCLFSFYGVVFAPQGIGWSAAGAFGGSVIAFGVLVLFDNWLWPAPGEVLLMESLGVSAAHVRERLVRASTYYLDNAAALRPQIPPPTSDLPAQMALLDQAVAEGISAHRRAVLLAAVTRLTRISFEVDRLIITTRQNIPRQVREMLRPEILTTVDAIAAVLDELAQELPTRIPVGVDEPPPFSRTRARSAMNALAARILQIRPSYIGKSSAAEIENFASFTDSLETITRLLEHLLDEPPKALAAVPSNQVDSQSTETLDPAVARYALKVGLCAVSGYVVGVVSHRPELSTVLTTVLITALPTYGAVVRKMILRIVGAIIGGIVSLLAIIIVSPNFENLPSYLLTIFVVFYVSAYCALASGRIAYAGKQIGTTFALVFAGLSPSLEVFAPLWRIWSVLLGTFIVGIVSLVFWPEYAGDSLLPRLRKVIDDTLALAPGGASANDENEIDQTNSQTMRILAEILLVADDAQVEGRASLVNHEAIVEAAGTLRRIANRFASIATGRIATSLPQLDLTTEYARETVFVEIKRYLRAWFQFFGSAGKLSASAANAIGRGYSPESVSRPLEQFSSRLEEGQFARVASWTLEQRRTILAELHSMRRLEFLLSELNRWLARIPGH